jgi:hypothetical protein
MDRPGASCWSMARSPWNSGTNGLVGDDDTEDIDRRFEVRHESRRARTRSCVTFSRTCSPGIARAPAQPWRPWLAPGPHPRGRSVRRWLWLDPARLSGASPEAASKAPSTTWRNRCWGPASHRWSPTESVTTTPFGSVRTHEDRLRRLREIGMSEQELARLSSPIGLDLGARTPEETAVPIAAEIIARTWGGTRRPLTSMDAPIHGKPLSSVPRR